MASAGRVADELVHLVRMVNRFGGERTIAEKEKPRRKYTKRILFSWQNPV